MLMMSLLYIFLFIQIDIFFGKEFSEAIEKKQVAEKCDFTEKKVEEQQVTTR